MPVDTEALFEKIKKLLAAYGKRKTFKVTKDEEGHYDLYGTKTVEAFNKTHDGMYFASVVRKPKHVALYFFPIYSHPDDFAGMPESLAKAMKGKSCFYIKRDDAEHLAEIKAFIKSGFDHYQSIGWL